MAQAQLELKLAGTVVDNKKGFLMLTAKGRLKKTLVHYLMRLVTSSPNRDEDKAETFNAFFASVFDTNDGPWDARSPGLEDHNRGSDKLPVDLNLCRICSCK